MRRRDRRPRRQLRPQHRCEPADVRDVWSEQLERMVPVTSQLCTSPQMLARPKAALPVMLRPRAADAHDVERAARDDRIMIRCAAGAEVRQANFSPFISLFSS
jgi:hypothetical protein